MFYFFVDQIIHVKSHRHNFSNLSSWQEPFWFFGKDRCLKEDREAAKTEALKCAKDFLADIQENVD